VNVSVALATCDGEQFLREQLDSLAAQSRPPVELVACDDASTDSTRAILDEFAARSPFPVRIEANERRAGPGDSFLQAASRCRGEFIAFCDQDDVWAEDKLERSAAALAAGDVTLALHVVEVVDERLRPTGALFPEIGAARIVPGLATDPWLSAPGMAMVFSSKLLRLDWSERPRAHDRDAPILHDQWIYLLARSLARVAFLPDRLARYRQHGANVLGAPDPEEGVARNAFQFGWAYYRGRARQAADSERTLGRLARSAANPEERRRLEEAAAWYGRLALALEARVRVYDPEAAFLRRTTALARLVRSGGYAPRVRGGLGSRSLAKDVAIWLGAGRGGRAEPG
jgi:glycosyltransferase involved in cell wall biosynthesis